MIYLASPYTHPDPAIRHLRYQAACRETARLLASGVDVFSPIVYTHHLVEYGLPVEWPFWANVDAAFIHRCDSMRVLCLPGWKQSHGIAEEIRIATELGMTVTYTEPAPE